MSRLLLVHKEVVMPLRHHDDVRRTRAVHHLKVARCGVSGRVNKWRPGLARGIRLLGGDARDAVKEREAELQQNQAAHALNLNLEKGVRLQQTTHTRTCHEEAGKDGASNEEAHKQKRCHATPRARNLQRLVRVVIRCTGRSPGVRNCGESPSQTRRAWGG